MLGRLWLQEDEAVEQVTPALALLPGYRGPAPGALAVSLVLHILGAAVLPPLERWIPRPPPQYVAESQRGNESRRIIFWVPPRARIHRELVGPRRERPKGVDRPAAPSPPELPVVAARPRPAPTNRLALPADRKASPEMLLVYPAPEVRDRRTVKQLPSIAVWTGSRIPPPEAVVLGAAKPAAPAPPADTNPALTAPVPGAAPGDVSIPSPKPARSRLTLPPASAAPVSAPAFDEPVIVVSLPGESQAGVPVTVIAITDTVPKPGTSFTVPQGQSTGSPAAAEAEKANSRATETRGDFRTPERSAGGTGTVKAQAGKQGGGGAGTGPPKPGGTGAPGAGGTGTASQGSSQPSRTFTIPTSLGAIQVSDWLDGLRRLRFPEKGAFDVVVLGAGLPPGIPPVQTLLKGRPIYTTYIQVGSDHDWIMQYCPNQPPRPAEKKSSMVVSLAPEPRLEAPYVQFAVIPLESPAESGKYLAYYFRISADGKVSDVWLAGGGVEQQATLRTLLESWRFRPAIKGGQGVPLEAVLLVPPGRFVQ